MRPPFHDFELHVRAKRVYAPDNPIVGPVVADRLDAHHTLLAKLRLSLSFSLPISLHLPVPILFSSLFSFLLSTLFLYPPSLRPLLIGSHQGSSTRVNVQRFLDRNPVISADLTLLDSR